MVNYYIPHARRHRYFEICSLSSFHSHGGSTTVETNSLITASRATFPVFPVGYLSVRRRIPNAHLPTRLYYGVYVLITRNGNRQFHFWGCCSSGTHVFCFVTSDRGPVTRFIARPSKVWKQLKTRIFYRVISPVFDFPLFVSTHSRYLRYAYLVSFINCSLKHNNNDTPNDETWFLAIRNYEMWKTTAALNESFRRLRRKRSATNLAWPKRSRIFHVTTKFRSRIRVRLSYEQRTGARIRPTNEWNEYVFSLNGRVG